MATNVLVTFYSAFGHIHSMVQQVEKGAAEVTDTEVRARQIPEFEEARKALSAMGPYEEAHERMKEIPEVTHDDLRWAHGIIWGTPTRYGNMVAQMEHKLTGGSPYGPSTVAGGDGSAQPTEGDLSMARKLGIRVAKVAGQLKALRS